MRISQRLTLKIILTNNLFLLNPPIMLRDKCTNLSQTINKLLITNY